MEAYLKRLVTDNSIQYQDDKNNSAWTVGYYLGNAQIRVKMAWEKLQRSPEYQSVAAATPIAVVVETWELNAKQTLFEWEITHNSLRQVMKILKPEFSFVERIKALSDLG